MKIKVFGPNLTAKQQRLGTFHVHAPGCRDCRNYDARESFEEDATSKEGLVSIVYSDIIDESGGCAADYLNEFYFAPCVDALPERSTNPDDVRAAPASAPRNRWVPRAKYDEVLAHMGDAEANRKVHLAERDAAIACNEAMREPMRRLRAVVDMPAQGEGTVVDEVIARLDAAIAARDEAVRESRVSEVRTQRVMLERDAAERARDEVGIQLAAAQAEIARLTKGLREVERFMLAEWRPPAEAVLAMVRDVAAGGPSVPGDALAPRITAALEASGIDTSNVKGVE